MPVTPLNGSTATSEMNYQTQLRASTPLAVNRLQQRGFHATAKRVTFLASALVNFESAIITCKAVGGTRVRRAITVRDMRTGEAHR